MRAARGWDLLGEQRVGVWRRALAGEEEEKNKSARRRRAEGVECVRVGVLRGVLWVGGGVVGRGSSKRWERPSWSSSAAGVGVGQGG